MLPLGLMWPPPLGPHLVSLGPRSSLLERRREALLLAALPPLLPGCPPAPTTREADLDVVFLNTPQTSLMMNISLKM